MRRFRWGTRGGSPTRPERLGWAGHWDPHPMCWLESTLRANPYRCVGLGMRACSRGGVAITLPGTTLLLGTAPVDRARVTWAVQTHDPARPDAHHPQVYGEFTWTALRPEVLDRKGGVFRLPDGSALDVAEGLEPSDPEPRYRIASRVEPGRLIPATETWADLAAIERIAVRVHSLLSPKAHPDRAGDGRSVGAG